MPPSSIPPAVSASSPAHNRSSTQGTPCWQGKGTASYLSFKAGEAWGCSSLSRATESTVPMPSPCSLALPGDAATVCHPLSPGAPAASPGEATALLITIPKMQNGAMEYPELGGDPQRSPSPTPDPAQPQQSHPGHPWDASKHSWSRATPMLCLDRSGRCSICR